METRLAIAFARRAAREEVNVSAVCRELGISRDRFYVYETRFLEEGLAGLLPRSRAPHSHPNQTPVELEEVIEGWWYRLRADGWDHGAQSIHDWMARACRQDPDQPAPPSARTVHRVLRRRGLSQAEPQKRPRSSYRRFAATAPNGMWQIDGLETALANGRPQIVLRVLDDHSRRALATIVADSEDAQATWTCLLAAMNRHGLPAVFLSDNSLAFNGSRKGILVHTELRLRELGVAVVAASARHPQTCGKAEREHKTFRRWLAARPVPATPRDLQQLCEIYQALYNHDRPHQSLAGATPAEVYDATPPAIPATTPLPLTPTITHATVSARGEVSIGSRLRVQVGRGWEGTPVDIVRDGNSVAIFHHHELIEARVIDPTRRYQPRLPPPDVLSGI